jgi:hypothetical protein
MDRTVETSQPATMSRRRTRALAVAGAALATSLLWLAAHTLGIELRVDPRNGQPPGVVSLPFAAGLSLVFSLLGWAVLALLERSTSRARTIWTVLATAVLLLSFAPILLVGATAGTKIVLFLMHISVAGVLIPVLRRTAARPASS